MLESDHQGDLALAAPSEGSGPLPALKGDNPKLAHLFTICSNLKLTSPKESIGIERRFFVNNYK